MTRQHGIAFRIQTSDLRLNSRSYLMKKLHIFRPFFLVVRIKGRTQKHFIHVSPNDDRRIIIVLTNHFRSLFHTVVHKRPTLSNGIYNRNFNRSQQPQLITHLHHNRILRIMSHSQEITSHILTQLYIPDMHFIPQGIPHSFVILMPAGTNQFPIFPVQEKTFLRIKMIFTNSQRINNAIENFSLFILQTAIHLI